MNFSNLAGWDGGFREVSKNQLIINKTSCNPGSFHQPQLTGPESGGAVKARVHQSTVELYVKK